MNRTIARPVAAMPTANELYHAAQGYIAAGQPVFPCKASGLKAKAPLTHNGVHDATLDKATCKRWWSHFGNSAAIGLATGVAFDVLDVDIKKAADGRVHLPFLTRMGLLNGCQKVLQTPSGGWHLYFVASGVHIKQGMTNKASANLGLDVRGVGGYVLGAPSYIETPEYAGAYGDAGPVIGSTREPLMWDLIVNALTPGNNFDAEKRVAVLPSERRTSIAALREWVANLQAGERNNGLHWAVCRCIDNNIDPHELVEPALLAGLEEAEVLLTVEAAMKRAGLTESDMDTEVEAQFPQSNLAAVEAAADAEPVALAEPDPQAAAMFGPL